MEKVLLAFGEEIRQKRLESGLNQEVLAGMCGLSSRSISLIENGKQSPGIDTVFALAKALGVRTSNIIEKTQKAMEEK